MKKTAIAVALLIPSMAFAQQTSPSTLAIRINGAVNGMALELEQAHQTILELQKQITTLQETIKAQEKAAPESPKK